MGLASELLKLKMENAAVQRVTQWISTKDPILDQRLSGTYHNGGLPVGRVVEIAGESSSGKTLIATQCMVSAQEMGGVSIFMDYERSFDIDFAKSFGLDDDPDKWVYHTPDTYEEGWEKVKDILYLIRGITVSDIGKISYGTPIVPMDKPLIVVFDSLAAMTPQAKYGKSSDKLNMKDNLALAVTTSATMDVIAKVAEKTNTCIVFLNQVRVDPMAMFGDNKKTTGGNSLPYYASVRVMLSKTVQKEKIGNEYVNIGQTVTCNIPKNKTSRPFGKCKWDFLFTEDGMGVFDTHKAIASEMIKIGLISQTGAWYHFDGEKYQGETKLIDALKQKYSISQLTKFLPTGRRDLVDVEAPDEGLSEESE